MARYGDLDALKNRMFNYYECVNETTGKSNYRGETLMNYEVADMIEDCIDNAPTADVVPRSMIAKIFEDIDITLNTAIWSQELEIKTNRAIGFNADAERFALRKKAIEDVKDYLQIVKKKYTEGKQ